MNKEIENDEMAQETIDTILNTKKQVARDIIKWIFDRNKQKGIYTFSELILDISVRYNVDFEDLK